MLTGDDDEERNVAVLQVVAAVLGDLTAAAGVDDAVLGDADDVWLPGVGGGDTHEVRGLCARVDLLSPEAETVIASRLTLLAAAERVSR